MLDFAKKATQWTLSRFGAYEAAEDSRKRKPFFGSLAAEDRVLDQSRRRQMIGNARDMTRNFAVAAWAVRKHLDYVASFRFQSASGSDRFDEDLEKKIANWQKASNCDLLRRHSLGRFLRILEARRTLEGDVGIVKVQGGKLQAIEADRVKNPDSVTMDTDTWVQGVKVDRFGAPIAFGVAKRNRWGGYRNARVISAKRMTLLGYFDRFDQYRGVSPMAPALTPFRDVNENIGYALAKAKISQLFGLVTKRDDPEEMGDVSGDGPGDYEIDFGDGPFSMEIDREDEVDILESNTPALSFQQFQQSVIALALKALDIPFSFYDESFTNFYGSRAGLIQYQKSCKSKRADLQDFLNDVTDWLIRLWVLDGSLQLPRGMRVADLHFNWLPDGVPWWKPTEEAKGQIMSVEAGFKSPQSVCAELGTDFYENVDQTQKAIEYAKARGVSLSYVLNGGGSNGGSDDKAKP